MYEINLSSEAMSHRSETLPGMGDLIGYARVSTIGQDPQLQLDALTGAGCIRTFTDHASGATADRPQLTAALDHLRTGKGDTLVVWKLDRLGRSLRDLVDIVTALAERDVGFRSLTDAIDTTTAGGRLVFGIFASLAEFERDLISERTHAGLAAARARGRVGGRPPALSPVQLDAAQRMRDSGEHTMSAIAAALAVSRPTLYRHLQKPC